MRVLLVNPANVGNLGLQNILQVEPLGLETIGAALAPDHDVRILDLRYEPGFEAFLRRWQPDIVGISCLYTSHTGATWDLAKRSKLTLPNVPVVTGGHPPTLAPQYFASPDIDAIVPNDGELTMPELCAAMEAKRPLGEVAGLILNTPQGQIRTSPRPRPKDLSTTPAPKRDLPGVFRNKYYLALQRPTALMEVSRGCPFSCNFCSIWKFAESRVRSLSVEAAVAELAAIPEKAVFFVDDHFFLNIRYMEELGRAIAKANLGKRFQIQTRADAVANNPQLLDIWKEAGLHAVFLGLERFTDSGLEEVRKDCKVSDNEKAVQMLRERGLGVVGNFMIDPRWGREDFESLRSYVREKNYAFTSFCIATPFPGTDMWRARFPEITTQNFELYDIHHTVMKTKLPLPEFYDEYAKCWQLRYQMQPKARMLHTIKRVTRLIFKEGLNLELFRNAKRFDRMVQDGARIRAEHDAKPVMGWEGVPGPIVSAAG